MVVVFLGVSIWYHGHGGLISTAQEFIRFRQALEAGDVVSLHLVDLAQIAHVAENPEGLSYYGCGVVTQERSSVGPII